MRNILLILVALSWHVSLRAQDQVDSNSTLNPTLNLNADASATQLTINDTNTVLQIKDTSKADTPYLHQVKFGIDLLRLGMNFTQEKSQGFQVSADYLFRTNWYGVVEAGYGSGKIDWDHLKYTTNSYNLKIGIDKSMLDKIHFNDLDILFFGFRYGIGIGSRDEAQYSISSTLGSPIEGNIPKENFIAHWGEMNAGIRVEMFKNVYLGWNFRAKFLINSGRFSETIKPIYISGYGSADKNTVFDFSIFMLYAIKWVK